MKIQWRLAFFINRYAGTFKWQVWIARSQSFWSRRCGVGEALRLVGRYKNIYAFGIIVRTGLTTATRVPRR